jgi:hypothetical protein
MARLPDSVRPTFHVQPALLLQSQYPAFSRTPLEK